jgi:SAM-dependent methyltransferase
MNDTTQSNTSRGWDTYWQGAGGADAYVGGGVTHPVITEVWVYLLGEILAERSDARILDIASGSGAVVDRLQQFPDMDLGRITCVDISSAAIESLEQRFPGITGITADAGSTPLEDASYDLVTSQFGIEYAGQGAIDEAIRLVAPGGSIVLVMHIRPGRIFNECAQARDAVAQTRDSGFVKKAGAFLEAGFAAVRGGDRRAYEQAGATLNPAIEKVERIMRDFGQDVAGGTISQLYGDVQRIHSKLPNFDPDEVMAWIGRMDDELNEYQDRMQSMCDAALHEGAFEQLGEKLQQAGFTIGLAKGLLAEGDSLPLAWVLRAVRSAA